MFVRHHSGAWFDCALALLAASITLAIKGFDATTWSWDSLTNCLMLRALYGLKNAKGTSHADGGRIEVYSAPARGAGGPRVAKEAWGYGIRQHRPGVHRRLNAARADAITIRISDAQAAAILRRRNVKLATDRKFVGNACLGLHVCRQLLWENGASNFDLPAWGRRKCYKAAALFPGKHYE